MKNFCFLLLWCLARVLHAEESEGEISAIDRKANSITLSTKKGMLTYRVRPDSDVTVNGAKARFADLNTGMAAKAISAEPSIASKIIAQSVAAGGPGNAASTAAEKIAAQPLGDADRLVRAYGLLKNAEQMAVGGLALSIDDLSAAARAMPAEALKKACLESVEHTVSWSASGPDNRRPDTFAYLKNAVLRLDENREEDPGGHQRWAKYHRGKLAAAIQSCADAITRALSKP